MKLFDISDVLSITTGRLVSNRHMDGVYEILNFLTGDNLFTHQLLRAAMECEGWLRAQYPMLFPENETLGQLLETMCSQLQASSGSNTVIEQLDASSTPSIICQNFVSSVKEAFGLPQMLPVQALGENMHTRIDPIEELKAMVGDSKVIELAVEPKQEKA